MNYKPNFKELDNLTEEGFLRKVISPCGKLVLYNYTDLTTYKRKWNKHTLNSRGTVYEIATGVVVACAFPKFFNFSELAVSKQRNLLKSKPFTVHEKMDGSLGIVYFYDGEWRVNTRGSFTSDQAVKAKEMLSRYNLKNLPTDYTLLVEIIYPENKIIVNYGNEEKLTILSIYSSEWNYELHQSQLQEITEHTKLDLADVYEFDSLEEIIQKQSELPLNEEGYVVRFNNGERVKFKGLEYLRVARLLSSFSPLTLWESMVGGKVNAKLLEELPEEFKEEYEEVTKVLELNYKNIKNEVFTDVFSIHIALFGRKDLDTSRLVDSRKDVGLFLKKNKIKHSGAVFPYILDNKNGVDTYIKKTIRPTGNIL